MTIAQHTLFIPNSNTHSYYCILLNFLRIACNLKFFNAFFSREESLETVLDYLKALPHRQLEPVKCGCRFLDEKIVSAIVDAVDEVKV